MIATFVPRALLQQHYNAFEAHVGQQSPAPNRADPTYTVPLGEELTVFHSRTVPPCSLWDMACVVQKSLRIEDTLLAAALVLARRFDATSRVVTAHMVHRLYAACLQVAMKAHSDVFYSNKCYAAAVGVPLSEMNRLEKELLESLGWRVQVTAQEVEELPTGESLDSPRSQPSSPTCCPSKRYSEVPQCVAHHGYVPTDYLVRSRDTDVV